MKILACTLALLLPLYMFSAVTVIDGDAEFTVDFANTLTNADFITGPDNIDQAVSYRIFYRLVGEPDESEIGLPNSEIINGNEATITWNNVDAKGFDVVLHIILNDEPGNKARLSTTTTVFNNNTNFLNINIFNYIDLNVDGTGTDNAELIQTGLMRITDPISGNFIEFHGGSGPTYGVTSFPVIRNQLIDFDVDDFNNTGLPFTGDFAGVFQTFRSIPPNSSSTIQGNTGGNTLAVPVPAIPTLTEWGLFLFFLLMLNLSLVYMYRFRAVIGLRKGNF